MCFGVNKKNNVEKKHLDTLTEETSKKTVNGSATGTRWAAL